MVVTLAQLTPQLISEKFPVPSLNIWGLKFFVYLCMVYLRSHLVEVLEAIGIAHATYAWEWLIKKIFFRGREKQELKIYPEDEEMIDTCRGEDVSDQNTEGKFSLEQVAERSQKEKTCSSLCREESGNPVDSVRAQANHKEAEQLAKFSLESLSEELERRGYTLSPLSLD